VDTPEGPKDCATCLSHDQVFKHGVAADAIIGVLQRPLESSEAITPTAFAGSRKFIEFMHSVIARRAPELPGLIAEAKRQGEGWVYVVDQRTPTPQDAVPPEDIIGASEIQYGQVVPESYHASPKHKTLSANGFFRLGARVTALLIGGVGCDCRRNKSLTRSYSLWGFVAFERGPGR
jgi:hypothetical protein